MERPKEIQKPEKFGLILYGDGDGHTQHAAAQLEELIAYAKETDGAIVEETYYGGRIRHYPQLDPHPVSGEIKEVRETEFMALFDPELHDKIMAAVGRFRDAEAVVCFEVLDMGSSLLGCRTALVVGPSCTSTLVQAASERLGDSPSRFAYPKYVWRF